MQMLIKSLKTKTSVELDGDTVWQWQLEKLNQLGMMNMQTVAELTETSRQREPEATGRDDIEGWL